VRSIKRHYLDLDDIYIISEVNPNIPGTYHFYYENLKLSGYLNYIKLGEHLNHKVYTCASKLGLKEFIHQNDDQYWLKPINDNFFRQEQAWLDQVTIEQLTTRKQSLLAMNTASYWHWELFLINTLLFLQQKNKPFINYTSHMPTHLTVKEMEVARDFFGGWGFQHNCGIFNLSEPKIKAYPTVDVIKKGLYDKQTNLSNIDDFYFLSHDDLGLTNELKNYIVSTFYA